MSLLPPATVPSTVTVRLRGRAFTVPTTSVGAVGPQRGQAGREQSRRLRAEGHLLVGFSTGTSNAVGQPLAEVGPAGPVGQVFLHPHHRPAGEHGEPVQGVAG